jgi:hypothetical protein
MVNIFFLLYRLRNLCGLGFGCWCGFGEAPFVIRFVIVVYPSVPHEVLRLGSDCRSFFFIDSYDLCEWGVPYQIASCDSFYRLLVEVEE